MYFHAAVDTRDVLPQSYTLLYFLSLKYISGDELNTYRDLLKQMNAKIYIQTSVRNLRDTAGAAIETLQQLHVIFTNHEETLQLLTKVRSYYGRITKYTIEYNVI